MGFLPEHTSEAPFGSYFLYRFDRSPESLHLPTDWFTQSPLSIQQRAGRAVDKYSISAQRGLEGRSCRLPGQMGLAGWEAGIGAVQPPDELAQHRGRTEARGAQELAAGGVQGS